MHLAHTSNRVRNFNHGHIQALLFDFDGVVIDSEPVHEQTLQIAGKRLGLELSQGQLLQLKGMNQKASAETLKSFVPSSALDCEEIIQIRAEAFDQLIDNVRLMPGVLKFILRLKISGFAVALTTSSGGPGLADLLDRFGLSPLFDVIVTGDDVTNSKPHPEPYRLTAQRLGIEPKHCIAIEDSVNGIISATAAGCRAIGLTTSFPKEKLLNAGAIFIIDSFEQLLQIMFSASPIRSIEIVH